MASVVVGELDSGCSGLRERLERAAAGADEDRQVVDEAGRADPTGHGEQRLAAIPLRHVLEGVRVDEHEVVDEGERLAHEDRPGGATDRGRALGRRRGAGAQRGREAQGRLAVGRA